MTTTTADIIIVGGGVIGASTAFHLARKGAKHVVLVDRGPVGSGETGKSGGFVQTHWEDIHEVRLIARSREIFQHWQDEVGGDCGYVRGGYLHVTGREREADVRAVHEMLVDEKLESHWLDVAQLLEIQPLLYTDDLVGGAWEPSSGWANPLATTRSLAEAARRGGVTLREGVRVTKIAHEHGAITGVETSDGFVASRVVILAAGPWSLALHALPELALPIRLRRGLACYLERPGGQPKKEVGFYDEITGLYTHPAGDANFVGIDFKLLKVTDPDSYPTQLDSEYLRALLGKLAHRFPALATSEIQRGVAGLYDFTEDGQPIIDGPIGGLSGYYVATGFSGVGFKSAPATGLGLAELVLDGRATTVSIDHLKLARFNAATASAPGLDGIPLELIGKLQAVRALLTDDEQNRLIPYVMALPPDQLPAFAALLVSKSPDEIAAAFRAQLKA